MAAPHRSPQPLPALRARALPRTLLRIPARYEARRLGAEVLDDGCRALGVGNDTLGVCFGGEKPAAAIRTGAVAPSAGEIAMLVPLHLAAFTLLALLRERLRAEPGQGEPAVRRQLADAHLEAARVLLTVH